MGVIRPAEPQPASATAEGLLIPRGQLRRARDDSHDERGVTEAPLSDVDAPPLPLAVGRAHNRHTGTTTAARTRRCGADARRGAPSSARGVHLRRGRGGAWTTAGAGSGTTVGRPRRVRMRRTTAESSISATRRASGNTDFGRQAGPRAFDGPTSNRQSRTCTLVRARRPPPDRVRPGFRYAG